jgi:SpoU rRNA methylase family enzyme
MKKLSKLIVYVALALSPILFSHCTLTEDLGKLKTSFDSVKIALGTPRFNTQAHLVFVDAVTNLPIEDQDVKVSVSGRDAALMYNNMGAHLSEYTGKWGILDLMVDPHKVDTAALRTKPIEFVITPTMAGHVGTPQLVLISNPTTNNVNVPMINLSAPPAGYYSSTNVIVGNTNSNGQISGGTPISLTPRQFSKGSLSDIGGVHYLWFLNNTTLLDASGNTLVGEVSCNLYSGGASCLDIRTADNLYRRINKYFTNSIKLYVTPTGGVKTPVANFGNNGGVIYQQLINSYSNPNFYNIFGTPYKVGDQIERLQTKSLYDMMEGLVSTYNSKIDIVTRNDGWFTGGLVLNDTLKNVIDLDFTWGLSQPLTPVDATFNINGVINRPAIASYYGFKMIPYGTNLDGTINYYYNYMWDRSITLDFNNPTGNKQIRYTYYTADNYMYSTPDYFGTGGTPDGLTIDPAGFKITPNFSSYPAKFTQNIIVTEDIASATELVTANIHLTVVSQSNPSIEIKPNVNIQVGISGNMQSYSLKDGETKLSLKIGQPYIVHGQFGTSSAVGILTVKKVGTDYVGTFQLSMGSTLGSEKTFTVTDTGDKTIDITYKIPVADDVFNQFRK